MLGMLKTAYDKFLIIFMNALKSLSAEKIIKITIF